MCFKSKVDLIKDFIEDRYKGYKFVLSKHILTDTLYRFNTDFSLTELYYALRWLVDDYLYKSTKPQVFTKKLTDKRFIRIVYVVKSNVILLVSVSIKLKP